MLASALLGRLPQGMSTLAILLLVRGATHSYAAAGVAVGADALASAALAPLQGRLVDRFGRAKVLAPAALAQAVVLIALALAGAGGAPAGVLIPLSGLAGAVMPPIAPSVRALLREVIGDRELRERAYALESVTQELIWIVGPLVVALIVTVVSPEAALIVIAAVGVIGTLLFVRSPLARARAARPPQHERTPALANAQLRALLGPIALTGFGLGATEVGLPSLALHAGTRSATGLLLALWSVGSVLGGLLVRVAQVALAPGGAVPKAPGGGDRPDGTADHRALDSQRRGSQPAVRAQHRAGVLLPVRARRPGGDAGHRDRGVHVGHLGAGRRARRRFGRRRWRYRRRRRRGTVRPLVSRDAVRRGAGSESARASAGGGVAGAGAARRAQNRKESGPCRVFLCSDTDV